MQLRLKKWPCMGALTIVFLYIIIYIALSVFGEYSNRLTITGKYRYKNGLGMPDAIVWNPYMIQFETYNKNILGIAFSPLLLLDRVFWHRNKSIFE